MSKSMITVLIILLAPASISAAPPAATWSATVALDTVAAEPGDHVAVPIRLVGNGATYAGIYLPLRSTSPHLTIDSVSFVGSMKTSNFMGLANPGLAGSGRAEVTLAPKLISPVPVMPASDGLIATLWVSISESAPLGLAVIDSMAIDSMISDGGPSVHLWKFVHGSDNLGGTMLPSFRAGGVVVESATGIDDEGGSLPTTFALAQNYPNPFNPSTVIEFTLPSAAEVQLVVYNVLGQEVETLVDGRLGAGTHRIMFEASGRPSGVYFYRLSSEEGIETRKMTLVK